MYYFFFQEILNVHNSKKILQKTYMQVERKQKMVLNKRTVPGTKEKDENKKLANKLPSLNPDWGLPSKKHPRLFQNPLFAISTILKQLRIDVP